MATITIAADQSDGTINYHFICTVGKTIWKKVQLGGMHGLKSLCFCNAQSVTLHTCISDAVHRMVYI